MRLQATHTKPILFHAAIVALFVVQGCQQPSGTDQAGQQADKGKQVTVDVTGMT
jgi:hypothetical protein